MGKWRGCVEEIYPVGPQKVWIVLGDRKVKRVRVQSRDEDIPFTVEKGKLFFTIDQVPDHDIIVIE